MQLMRMLIDSLKQQLVDFLPAASGIDTLHASDIMLPPSPDKGDFAFPCFVLGKALRKAPVLIAKEIAEKILTGGHRMIESVAAESGYVNFTLAPGYVAQKLFETFQEEGVHFGQSNKCSAKKVMIEYSQPNTHKEFHVGHLRGTLIGDTLVRLHRAESCWTLAANYINDFGTHVAKCLWALKKLHPYDTPPRGEEGAWLGKVYVEGAAAAENDPNAKSEMAAVLRALEARDPEWFPLFLETREWSLQGFRKIYDELGVHFDDWFYESDIKDEGKEIVVELLERGIARKSEGAIIVDLTQYGLDIFLILKSDGSGLYSTSDLALAREKFRRYEVDEAVVITDVRQSFYFKQLFKTLELAGFNKTLKHVGYEFVRLPEGAMASRLGRVVLFEDVYESVVKCARQETRSRHADWSDMAVEQVARAVGLGALKFELLRHDPGKVLVFDAKKAVSFQGFTGPYVQYTVARIKSIFRKAGLPLEFPFVSGDADASSLVLSVEKKLMLAIAQFPNMVADAREQCDPSLLCRYVYETAHLFAEFYEQCHVVGAQEPLRITRLMLCSHVALVLTQGLALLGIEVAEEM